MTATTQGAGRHGQPPTDPHHADQHVQPPREEKDEIAEIDEVDVKGKEHTYPPQDDASSATNKSSDGEKEETEKTEHMRLRDMKGEYSYHKREHWW